MTVFKGFVLIAKRNVSLFVTYLVIFAVINLVVMLPAPDEPGNSAENAGMSIGVVDLDQSQLSRGLIQYLSGSHRITELADNKALLQERLVYRDVVYILTIPAGFEQSMPDVPALDVTRVCDVQQARYVDQMIHWYLTGIKTLSTAGYGTSDIVRLLDSCADVEAGVTIIDSGGVRTQFSPYFVQYITMPYVIIAITCYTLGSITMEFYKADILRRLRASAVSPLRRNIEFLAGYMVFGLVIWLFFNLIPLVLYYRQLTAEPLYPWLLVNSLALVLTALSMTAILGLLIRRQEVLTPVVNLLTLSMSFLCGVFVELDVLSDKLTAFSRFLPVYWYETVVNILASRRFLTPADRVDLINGIGLQLLFAAVFLSLSLVLGRIRTSEN